MDVLYEVEAHDAEILSIEYSDPTSGESSSTKLFGHAQINSDFMKTKQICLNFLLPTF